MNRQHLGIVIGGILLLMVAMGISRFAYTPLLPFMREDAGLSFSQGGLLASSNYVGYFLGALGAAFIFKNKKQFLLLNVGTNIISVLLMGILTHFTVWIGLRFLAGLTSGFIFVLTSSIVMDYLAAHTLIRFNGYLFSGIGLGITTSGLFVPYFESLFHWQGAWIGLSILCTIFLTTTLILWRPLKVPNRTAQKSEKAAIWHGFMPWLILAYGLEGLGYIVTGTFLVDIIYNIDALRSYAGYSWVVVGIAAIFSAPVWTKLSQHFSNMTTMILAYVLQIIGIVLPVIVQTVWSVLLSAFLFGFTFVGLVILTTGYARTLFPKHSAFVVSMLTTFYAIGQIIGPIFASRLETHYASFKAPLLFAGVVVSGALIFLLLGKQLHHKKQQQQPNPLYNE